MDNSQQKFTHAIQSLATILDSDAPKMCMDVDIVFGFVKASDPWVKRLDGFTMETKPEEYHRKALYSFLRAVKDGDFDPEPSRDWDLSFSLEGLTEPQVDGLVETIVKYVVEHGGDCEGGIDTLPKVKDASNETAK